MNTGTPANSPATILIIDDSITVRMSLSEVLTKNGYQTILAESGEEALRLIRSERIDVVILDLVMPGMGGTEVLREIRQDDELASLPVVMLTAVSDIDNLVENMDVGADDYLVKPWYDRELLARLKSMVRMKRAFDASRDGRDQLNSVLESVAEAIICSDSNGQIVSWNGGARSLFGYDDEEIIGQSLTTLMPQSSLPALQQALTRVHAEETNAPIDNLIELTGVRKDGSEFPLELSLASYLQAGERFCTAVIRNITERKQAEARLAELNQRLVEASRKAGMAELATDVLHNVGNVLNSVNVSADLTIDKVRQMHIDGVSKLSTLINQHIDDIAAFMTTDDRGKRLPEYLSQLASRLSTEHNTILDELNVLLHNVEHIKEIVAAQQAHTTVAGAIQPVRVPELVADALKTNAVQLEADNVQVARLDEELPSVNSDRHKLMQILVNLISNARQALAETDREDRQLTIRTFMPTPDRVAIEVADNGIGIPKEHLTRIFSHGFTTKKDGHGFGLHSSALAAREVGGSLTASSDGLGHGSTFKLEIPVRAE